MFPILDPKATGVNLRRIMDEQGFSVKQIQQYLGISSVQSVYHWLNGITMPSLDNLYALSQLFQMPMDALVCGNRTIYPKVDYVENRLYAKRMALYFDRLSQLRTA